jgi:hypothetical protein
MGKKNVSTNFVVLLVLAGLLGYALLTQAGNLEPSAAPAPTMKTLQQVYDAASAGINEREGFCQYFEVPEDSNQVLLTVPAGKRFVLLKLHARNGPTDIWSLTVNDNLFIDGTITDDGYQTGSVSGEIMKFTHDFPDRCVVVDAGQTLKAVNDYSTLEITIIGYYYDVP